MQYIGNGYCNNCYYAGQDSKGEESEEKCKNLCIREKQCSFATYLDKGSNKTCIRYNEGTCILNTTNIQNDVKDSRTFAKLHKTFVKATKKEKKKGLYP